MSGAIVPGLRRAPPSVRPALAILNPEAVARMLAVLDPARRAEAAAAFASIAARELEMGPDRG